MSSGWNNYSDVRIAAISWPPAEGAGSGLVQTRWSIETLDDISEDGLRRLTGMRFDQISREMSFTVEAPGPRAISMACTCDQTIPGPLRLGAASVAWRLIDETVSRIWMIGDEPRSLYPEFMHQRRQLVERLSVPHRRLWMWLSLVRSSPVLSAMVGESGDAELILSMMLHSGASGASLVKSFSRLSDRIDVSAAEHAAGDLGLKDIGRLWVRALESAVSGSQVDSVDLMSYATERVFDLLMALESSIGAISASGLAAAEDIAWFEDSIQLAELGDDARPLTLDRCRASFSRVMEFCAQPAARLALESAARNR